MTPDYLMAAPSQTCLPDSAVDIYYEGVPPGKALRAEATATWETGDEDESGRIRVDITNANLLINEKIRIEILATDTLL